MKLLLQDLLENFLLVLVFIVFVVRLACYFGETGQRRGLSGRLKKWKQNLRAGEAGNQKLQADWNLYGEDAFEFSVEETGSSWSDKEQRDLREAELINNHFSNGGILYNFLQDRYAPRCHLEAKGTIIHNQTDEFRAAISKMNTGR